MSTLFLLRPKGRMALAALAFLGFQLPGLAATVNAASCSQPDVAAAISTAARNDTVVVPAGNCTWTSPVTVSKGLTVQGAGAGSTVLLNGGGTVQGSPAFFNLSPDSTAIANDEIIKVAGFTFDGNGAGYALVGIHGASGTGTKPFKNLIITGNTFQRTGSASGQGNRAIYGFSGQYRGVIYGNTFDRCDILMTMAGSDTTSEWTNTLFNNFSYGSADNLFFENNVIKYSVPWTSSEQAAAWIETGQGARLVVRFNTWNMANAGGQSEFWDIHGFQNFYGGTNGQTGTMLVEYYGNSIINAASTVYRWIDHRGSWGMYFNNTYSGASSPSIEVNQYNGGCTNQILPVPSDYNPIVNNTYAFNNMVNGKMTSMRPGSVNSCGVTENNNFWNYTSTFNGTAGMGSGPLSARPSTCTAGVGYWATDQGSWNQSGSGGQGAFYKCTATNTWTPYYTPYTYPHPLTTGSGGSTGGGGGGATAPNAPTLSAIVR